MLEGDAASDMVYGTDPLGQARDFVRQGARWLHVVDMDRALRTGRDNSAIIGEIASLEHVEVQLGGNIDSEAWARDAAATSSARIVIGTAAALRLHAFRKLVRVVGKSRCGLAIDTRGGVPELRGGADGPANIVVEDLVLRALDEGVTTIIYRSLERDGTTRGADIRGACKVVGLGADVIVAGGIASLDDIRSARNEGLAGVIVGRALYEGRFSLAEALQCC